MIQDFLGSLASILAFACPLSYLVRLLSVSPLLKCVLRVSKSFYNRYRPEFKKEPITGIYMSWSSEVGLFLTANEFQHNQVGWIIQSWTRGRREGRPREGWRPRLTSCRGFSGTLLRLLGILCNKPKQAEVNKLFVFKNFRDSSSISVLQNFRWF